MWMNEFNVSKINHVYNNIKKISDIAKLKYFPVVCKYYILQIYGYFSNKMKQVKLQMQISF